IEIARALISAPRVLLLDERAVGLSLNRIVEVDALMRRIRDERGVSIVLVGRVIRRVMDGSDRIPRLNCCRNTADVGTRKSRARRATRAHLAAVVTLFPVLRVRQSRKAGTLSGGEQQMLAIGRALMARPRLLLMAEPSAGLSPVVVQALVAAIQRLHARGLT